nr:hypothetical protein [Tanacetum cinerariifolium]
MPFRSESEVKRLLAIPTPPLPPVSLTSYTLPPLLMPLPIYTPLPTSSFPLPSSIPSTSSSESIPEADIPLQKRARFTTPTSRYEIGESFVAAARQIRPTLTIAESRRADVKLIDHGLLPVTRGSYQNISDSDAAYRARSEGCVNAALAARDATRNGDDIHTSGTGARRPVQAALECSYSEFLKCKPLDFKDDALKWWNSHVKTTTPEAAHAMTWATLKKKMTDKYCSRGEIKKIEAEMWNIKVKGTDVVAYNRRFQQLALMCSRMFPEEVDKIEKYIGGLPDMILGSVKASKSKTMQEVIEFTTELMEDKTRAYAERQADNKRKSEDIARNNQNQQPNKRQNTGQAYTARNGDRKLYAGSRPLCFKCNYNHEGPFLPKCNSCKRVGHLTKDCKSRPANNNNNNNRNNNNQQGNGCFECEAQGHFKENAQN